MKKYILLLLLIPFLIAGKPLDTRIVDSAKLVRVEFLINRDVSEECEDTCYRTEASLSYRLLDSGGGTLRIKKSGYVLSESKNPLTQLQVMKLFATYAKSLETKINADIKGYTGTDLLVAVE
ncbi:hypothetical protein [Neptuniibacter sp.]|uniref:hypothetical protein n=1 Tax=Neptuniibacter sp. TaxID=1962643 RepID=UPI002614DC1F|nr:hypothetical protein [Neptuniibacter sp.]MCP4597049.1 hypothetical protein [Neptuniibacter sp.]